MRTQTGLSYSILSEEEQEKDLMPSLDEIRDTINQFKGPLPQNKVLSYITNPVHESIDSDLEDQMSKETVPFKEVGNRPVLWLKTAPVQDNFISLQKWEGVVTEVMKDCFLARLHDLTEQGPDEEAEFPIEEVSEGDRELVMPGAIFYWNIGYHDSRLGQRRRSSIIRFRRLPAWRKKEIDVCKHEAKRIRGLIEWK